MGNLATIGATLGLGASADDILFGVFDAALTETRVRFVLPKRTYDIGKGGGDPEFVVRVADPRFARRVLTSGNLGMGETYMEGGWTMERERLAVLDVENIARHYLPTAQYWHDRFEVNKSQLDPEKYDARFIRMFEYLMAIYIAGCTALVSGVFQVLYTKNFRKNLPWHRL